MNKIDFLEFGKAWQAAHEIMPGGRALSQDAMRFCFEVLSEYPLPDVMMAIAKHAKFAKFAPTPADIINLLGGDKTAHISADEAWPIAVETFDQRRSVRVTSEILAAGDVAEAQYLDGYEYGARLAFREAYNRITKTAGPPKWFFSAGSDPVQRAEALDDYQRLGHAKRNEMDAHKHLLDKTTTTSDELIREAQRITGNVITVPKFEREKLKKQWSALSAELRKNENRSAELQRQEILARESVRLETERKKELKLDEARKHLDSLEGSA